MAGSQDYGLDYNESPQVQQQPAEAPQAGLAAAPAAAPAPAPAAAPADQPQPEKPVYQSDNPMTAALSFFRDPARLKLAAMAAAEAQRPDLMQWIQRGFEAQKENAIDAVGALAVGDKAKALQLFNASGDRQATSIEEGPTKGTHTIVFADGTRRDIDAKKELYRFLTPPEQYKAQHDTEVLDQKKDYQNQITELKRQMAEAKSAHDKDVIDTKLQALEIASRNQDRLAAADNAKAGLMTAQAQLATAQASLASAKAGNVGAAGEPKRLSQAAADKEINEYATKGLAGDVDPITQKAAPANPGEVLVVRQRAAQLYKADPSLGTADAVTKAAEDWKATKEKYQAQVSGELKDAKKGVGFFEREGPVVQKITGGKPEKEYVAQEVLKRAKAAFNSGGADAGVDRGAGTAPTASGDAAKITPASTNRTVGMPSTPPPNVPPAPFKEGTKLRGKDGRNYVVMNGLPQLDAVQPAMH